MSWTKVIPKRSGFRWDVFPLGGMNLRVNETGVTSFYVYEFPDYFNAKRLFEIFGCSGNVAEVAISPRRNNVGKRFAFARFRDVEDGRILAIRLDNILIEGKKLHVNLPRYDRAKNVASGRHFSSSLKRHGGHANPTAVYSGSFVKIHAGGKSGRKGSYAAALLKGQSSEERLEGTTVLEFQSDEVLKKRFEKAFVGRVCIPGSAYNIQNYLEMEGVFAIKATPIGGNCCLLEELEAGFIGDLIKEGESWWKSLFSTIEKWEVGSLDGSRDVWFRIYGVPLHVWCLEFFVALGEFWGRFVCLDDNTSKGETFDVARILVNIPLSLSIPEVVIVSIDGAKHKLCVREDAHNLYRHTSGIKKVQSSAADSSESSDSEFERLMVESTSGCSDEGEELEAKEGLNPNFGGFIEKGLALPDTLCVSHSGDVSEEEIRGKLPASFDVNSGGHNSRLAGSESKSDSGDKHPGVDSVLLKLLESEVGVVNSLETRSRSTHSGSGQPVLKGENGDVLSGERHSFGVVAPSEPTMISDMAISPNAIPSVRDVYSVRKSGPCSGKGVSSESGPDGDKLFNSFSGGPVRVADFINCDRSKGVRSESSKERFRSGMRLDPIDATYNICSDSVSVSSNVGGFLRAGLSKVSGAVALSSSDRIEDSINCLDGASGSRGVGTVALKINSNDNSQSNSGKEFQYGGRGGRKSIRKVSLVHEQNGGGKGRLKDKYCTSGKLKGALPSVHSRGSVSTCYGE